MAKKDKKNQKTFKKKSTKDKLILIWMKLQIIGRSYSLSFLLEIL